MTGHRRGVSRMSRLYERSAEIAAIDRAVAGLGEGRGSAVLVEARAGRGKSTLVEYAVSAARAAGAPAPVARAPHPGAAGPVGGLRPPPRPAGRGGRGGGGLPRGAP